MVFLELRRDSRVPRRFQASSCVGPRKPKLPFDLQGKAGGYSRVTAGPKRTHLGVCPGPNSLSREDRDLGVALQTPYVGIFTSFSLVIEI